MTKIRRLIQAAAESREGKRINWYPGHMYAGTKAMIGKLNTVDCVVEVHDARIPFLGRNLDFKNHLGAVKPRILVLNKSDLADLSRWNEIRDRLRSQGDERIVLSDLTGGSFSVMNRGYDKLLQSVVDAINQSERNNRAHMRLFKIMVVGIPNVGKSTLINRLRQFNLGKRGEPAEVGPMAGVTKHVHNSIKVCSRPPIYCLDTPGVLDPGATKNRHQAMRLALCSTISDKVLNPIELANYLLDYLNRQSNSSYLDDFLLDRPASHVEELLASVHRPDGLEEHPFTSLSPREIAKLTTIESVCWKFLKQFRKGLYGKVIFEDQ